jgi:TRAP-type C4-dicarboxylate transport system permease small subunit
MDNKNLFQEIWSGEGLIRWWLVHSISDACMILSSLGIIWGFWEVILLMRVRHYPEAKLSSLEDLHFHIMYCVFVVLGVDFVLRLVAGLWLTKRR